MAIISVLTLLLIMMEPNLMLNVKVVMFRVEDGVGDGVCVRVRVLTVRLHSSGRVGSLEGPECGGSLPNGSQHLYL